MLENPFRTEEWTYYVGNRLIAVAYMDALPEALSAIYVVGDECDGVRRGPPIHGGRPEA